MHAENTTDWHTLVRDIKVWSHELGFRSTGIASVDLPEDESHLQRWLELGRHGSMSYMARHGTRRSRPAELLPGTLSVVSVRMDYQTESAELSRAALEDRDRAFVSRYALGRDYHKVMRARLAKLGERIRHAAGDLGYRPFVDSAPVLEKALARNAGLGWIGKHTNLINATAGSWFFLGELFTSLPLPPDQPAGNHCGSCRACIDVCPTRAIVAPYQLDARRCISYLTIEQHGPIPLQFRKAMGNRIYGCDDCQLFCPWNKFAQRTPIADFEPRHGLDRARLTDLFDWTEAQFLQRTEGSPIRRIGHIAWLRNIAVALGNATPSAEVTAALQRRRSHSSELVREHVDWAISQHAAPVTPQAN